MKVKHANTKHEVTVEDSDENLPPAKKLNLIHTPGTPAYGAKVKRPKRQCETGKEMICDLTNLTGSVVSEAATITVGYENLTQADLTILEQKGMAK